MIAVVLFGCVLTLALVIFQLGAGRIYAYAITASDFEVRLFGRLPVYRVARRDIKQVTLWRFSPPDLLRAFTTLRLGNRLFGPAVVIERQSGFPRFIVITPDDAAGTMAELAHSGIAAE